MRSTLIKDMVKYNADDYKFMSRAIMLAARGAGSVSPNPVVGCVISKNGRIISEGYHQFRGSYHAEVNAVQRCLPSELEGATLYVTLEPCFHTDKLTPPCATYLSKLPLQRVVVGAIDPNPKVSGEGVKKLREAGKTVDVGLLKKECEQVARIFFKNFNYGTPFIHIKAAISLDGKIANAKDESKWITDSKARTWAHSLRNQHDATAVGRGTLEADNPGLTVRSVFNSRAKYRILFADIAKLTSSFQSYQMFKDQSLAPTIVVSPESSVDSIKVRELESLGVRFLFYKSTAVSEEVLTGLFKMGISSMLIEGGSGLVSSFVKASNFDEMSLFIAPFMIGNGTAFYENPEVFEMSSLERLELESSRHIGNQVLLNYRRDR